MHDDIIPLLHKIFVNPYNERNVVELHDELSALVNEMATDIASERLA